jgi:hypothetical protein
MEMFLIIVLVVRTQSGWSEHSSAQVAKVDRKPCTVTWPDPRRANTALRFLKTFRLQDS